MRFINLLPIALLAATASTSVIPESSSKDGLRLIKTSDDSPGIWVTEDEKWDLFIKAHVPFVDVTDTQDLETLGAARLQKRQSGSFPSAPTHQSQVTPLINAINISNVQGWMNTMTNYHNRYYGSTYGVQAANWLYSVVQAQAGSNSRVTVRQYTHSSFSQKSIIAKIQGTGTGVVVIGAHLDSVGSTRTGRAPGADDNASGSLTILEAFRLIVASGITPTNSIEFHWYAGEEGGLLGSRDIFRAYASAGTNVKAMLNQDMTGYSPNNQFGVIADYTNSNLNTFVEKLVTAYTAKTSKRSYCNYGCSDHASANSAGFPAAMVFEDVFESSSPYIHSASDTVSTISFSNIKEHIKLTLGFAVEASYF